MTKYLYFVAGLRLRFDLPYPLHIGAESVPFLTHWREGERADWHFSVTSAARLPSPPPEAHREVCALYHQNRVWLVPHKNAAPYAVAEWEETERRTRCIDRTGWERYVNESKNLCQWMSLEHLLGLYSGLMLHAALVSWRGCGILFSAPSGVGKSTQAGLWETYLGAAVLNGDRAGLRRTAAGWMAYGLPFAGSSGIYRNDCARLCAVTVLRQGPENRVRRLSPSEALVHLLPELNLRRWSRTDLARGLDLLSGLLSEIPVWLLTCRPDEGAVRLLHDTIFSEEGRI